MKIERVGLKDMRRLQKIGAESYVPHYAKMWNAGGVEWYLNKCFGDEFLTGELADENVEYYIVVAGETDIGILKLVLRKPLPVSTIENAPYLEKIYFIKEYTGKGVGREVMNFAFNRVEQLNRETVWLIAMDTAPKPVAAYERAGFTLHARARLDFELMKDEYKGILIMKKHIEVNEN